MSELAFPNTSAIAQNTVPEYLVKKYHLKQLEEIRRFIPLKKGSILDPFSRLAHRIAHFFQHFQFLRTSTIQKCLRKECAHQFDLELEKFSKLTNITPADIENFEKCYNQIQTIIKVFSGTKLEIGLNNLFKIYSWGLQEKRFNAAKSGQSLVLCHSGGRVFLIPAPPTAPAVIYTPNDSTTGLDKATLKSVQRGLNHVPPEEITNFKPEGPFGEKVKKKIDSVKERQAEKDPPHVIEDPAVRDQQAQEGGCCTEDEWKASERDYDPNEHEDHSRVGSGFSSSPPSSSTSQSVIPGSSSPRTGSLHDLGANDVNQPPATPGRVSQMAQIFGGVASQAQRERFARKEN